MKALKLLLIFVVLVGGLFVALNWKSITTTVMDNDDNFVDKDLIDIGKECEEIRNAWGRCTEWDESLYTAQRADIDQSKSMGMFSREGYNTVNNALRESATNKACESYLACLHDTLFDSSKLQQQYDGVQFLKEHEQLENDPRVKEVEERHALYKKIDSFVRSPHYISPRFDAEDADWTSFATYQNSILGTARSYRNNQVYTAEMTHIPGFRNGLSENHVRSVTNAQRSRFYEALSAQIINHFETDSVNQENANRLNDIYKTFINQESNYGVERLATFIVNYRDQLDKLKANEQTIQP